MNASSMKKMGVNSRQKSRRSWVFIIHTYYIFRGMVLEIYTELFTPFAFLSAASYIQRV